MTRIRHIGRQSILFLTLVFATRIDANDTLPELEITEIQEGVYLHISYQDLEEYGLVSSNGLVVVEGTQAFIVDTPWSEQDTEELVQWIESQGLKPIGSISTHSHEDRTAGIAMLNAKSIPTYASKTTNFILKNQGKTLATNTLEAERVSLAGGSIEVFYPGPGHTVDNLVVWLPKQGMLYGGCFIRSIGSKSLGYTGEAFIGQWPESVDAVLAQYPSVQTVIPGHGQEGDITLLNHTKTLALSARAEPN